MCIENNDKRWSIGIKFVQFTKNLVHHKGIEQVPYKALFGVDVKCGLSSQLIDKEILSTLKTEEELERTYRDFLIKNNENPDELFQKDVACSSNSSENSGPTYYIEEFNNIEENRDLAGLLDEIEETENVLVVKDIIERTNKIRTEAKNAQEKQAAVMLKRSKNFFAQANVGDTVLVHLDKVDKSQMDLPNLMCCVVEIKTCDDKSIVYRVGNSDGMLKGWLTRDQFDVSRRKILKLDDVNKDKELSKRTANTATSVVGGQGMKFCNCKGQCGINTRCSCAKATPPMKCNSKCHPNSKYTSTHIIYHSCIINHDKKQLNI